MCTHIQCMCTHIQCMCMCLAGGSRASEAHSAVPCPRPECNTWHWYQGEFTHSLCFNTYLFQGIMFIIICFTVSLYSIKLLFNKIRTTRPIPPNRRSCLGCIRWKDMSNPKRLRWNIVLRETYESHSAITNGRKQCAIGDTRPIPPSRRSCQVAFYT